MTKMTYMDHKYTVLQAGNMFIAITQYGGRNIRAVAKCAPGDAFNPDLGAQLAMARCAQKVEKIRLRNLKMHQKTWADVVEMATKELTEVNAKMTISQETADAVNMSIAQLLDQAR